MANFTAGTSFTDGVTNDVTAAKLNALVADAVPTSNLSLTSTTGTIATFNSTTGTIATLNSTTGTIATLNSTTGTIATLNSTTGTIPTLVATTLITTGTGTAAAPAIVPTGDTNTGLFFPDADTIAFSEGGAEAMRINSSGNVGIGIAGANARLEVKNAVAKATTAVTNTINLSSSDASNALTLELALGSNSTAASRYASIQSVESGIAFRDLLLNKDGGNVGIGTADLSLTSGVGIKLKPDATIPSMGIVQNTSSNDTSYHLYNTNATNNGYRFYVSANGGISNFSANNVNLSDERLKTNINLAGNYLERICSIPVKTFNYKDQGEDTEKTIGVLAQEVEAHIPELISNNGFGETPADGIPLKTIYQTDLQYVLMRCIQELKTENDSLKSRIEALEAK
jgi:hypothetical protein